MYNNNNYGYTPFINQRFNNMMQPQQMQQPMPTVNENLTVQPVNNTYKLPGKIVDSIDTVRALDIPLDGSASYFPLASGEAIVTKQLQMDGTSKIVVYKPVNDGQEETPKYATLEDLQNSIKEIDLSDIDDLKDDIKEIRQEIKDIKKKKKDD